ncbi:MAG: ammonium transporter [Planctomycetes bacterium]|nr:ammonium transporter [Planctomycetota bacterium]
MENTLTRRVRKWLSVFLISLTAVYSGYYASLFAQEDQGSAPGSATTPVTEPASEAAPTTAPADSTLPGYITEAPLDPAKYPDPTGSSTGSAVTPSATPVEKADKTTVILGDGDPEKLTKTDLYARDVHNAISINFVWTLIAGFLVMFMQTGFMLVEVGLCRAKNSSHTAAMNLMVYPLGCLAFWIYGFAIGWGNWYNGPVPPGWAPSLGKGLALLNEGFGIGVADPANPSAFTYGLFGTKGFFLNGLEDVSVMVMFFFMMVFMDTTATIPTGSMAERWAWKNFCLYGLWVALPYCLYANWVWGGGWLAAAGKNWGLGHGAVDFAGSGVVHAMGGAIALAGAIVIGPRTGKFVNGKPQPMPAHHVPMVVAGTFILAFGWFGFNPGSTLAGTDLRISVAVVNTMLAGIVACLASMLTLWAKGLKPDTTMLCNGMLAGLVAITAPCAFVDAKYSALIGGVAGVLVVFSVFFWERVGIDDPVGAISVHGVNGTWGVISLGLFANGKYGAGWNGVNRLGAEFGGTGSPEAVNDGVRGLFFGDPSQLYAQLLSAGVVLVFGFVSAYLWFKFSNLITPLRVSQADEIGGLDAPEMGVLGYPEFTINRD